MASTSDSPSSPPSSSSSLLNNHPADLEPSRTSSGLSSEHSSTQLQVIAGDAVQENGELSVRQQKKLKKQQEREKNVRIWKEKKKLKKKQAKEKRRLEWESRQGGEQSSRKRERSEPFSSSSATSVEEGSGEDEGNEDNLEQDGGNLYGEGERPRKRVRKGWQPSDDLPRLVVDCNFEEHMNEREVCICRQFPSTY